MATYSEGFARLLNDVEDALRETTYDIEHAEDPDVELDEETFVDQLEDAVSTIQRLLAER
ncbi:MAG: hypothetical protein KF727_14380 [Microbacteriaceae bacterium]|nr:hypothetical protein [Microbacteriaceae bacterium]